MNDANKVIIFFNYLIQKIINNIIEVGMWIPLGTQISIPWQHPLHMSSTCYRINIYTTSANVSLMQAKALFAESSFNMSLDVNGINKLF